MTASKAAWGMRMELATASPPATIRAASHRRVRCSAVMAMRPSIRRKSMQSAQTKPRTMGREGRGVSSLWSGTRAALRNSMVLPDRSRQRKHGRVGRTGGRALDQPSDFSRGQSLLDQKGCCGDLYQFVPRDRRFRARADRFDRQFDLPAVTFIREVELTIEAIRLEEHTSELQSPQYLGCRLLLGKKKISP